MGAPKAEGAMDDFFRIESISQIHRLLGLDKPRHPLITLIEAADLKGVTLPEFGGKVRNELYLVSLKNGTECRFIYGTPLARKMREYTFFAYRANEALHVSEQERAEQASLLILIRKEYERNPDAYSTGIILSNLESLFGY